MDILEFYKKEIKSMGFNRAGESVPFEAETNGEVVQGKPVFKYIINSELTLLSDLPITHYTVIELIKTKGYEVEGRYV